MCREVPEEVKKDVEVVSRCGGAKEHWVEDGWVVVCVWGVVCCDAVAWAFAGAGARFVRSVNGGSGDFVAAVVEGAVEGGGAEDGGAQSFEGEGVGHVDVDEGCECPGGGAMGGDELVDELVGLMFDVE